MIEGWQSNDYDNDDQKETDIDQPPLAKVDNFVSLFKGKRNLKKIRCCQYVSKVAIPIVALSFIIIYWVIGLTLYLYP